MLGDAWLPEEEVEDDGGCEAHGSCSVTLVLLSPLQSQSVAWRRGRAGLPHNTSKKKTKKQILGHNIFLSCLSLISILVTKSGVWKGKVQMRARMRLDGDNDMVVTSLSLSLSLVSRPSDRTGIYY